MSRPELSQIKRKSLHLGLNCPKRDIHRPLNSHQGDVFLFHFDFGPQSHQDSCSGSSPSGLALIPYVSTSLTRVSSPSSPSDSQFCASVYPIAFTPKPINAPSYSHIHFIVIRNQSISTSGARAEGIQSRSRQNKTRTRTRQ